MSSDPGRMATEAQGNVLSFFAAGLNRPKTVLPPHEPRGEVLLFTGVRYERRKGRSANAASDGSPRPTRGGRRG